ncbi:MAG TPA: hypothetical protein VF235_07420 [Actinomycetota bacterium]
MRWHRTMATLLAAGMVAALGLPAARAEAPMWRREPGGTLEAVAEGGGFVYVTGSVRWSDDLVVAKYSTSGALLWRRTWRVRKHDWHASGETLALAPDGGVYVGGASGFGEGADALLLRYSPDGRLLWERTLATQEGHAHIVGLAVLGDRVVAAVADGGCCAIWDHDAYVQAFGHDGSRAWRTDFEVRGVPAGTWDSVSALAVGAGRIVVAGEVDRAFWAGDSKPLPDEDLAIQTLGPTGRVLWTRVLGDGRTGRDWDRTTDVDMRGSLVVVTGTTWRTRHEEPQAWVGAFDLDGHRRWTRRWGEGARFRSATAASIAPWGGVYVGTATWPNEGAAVSFLRRFTPAGTLRWSRLVGGSPHGFVTDASAHDAVYVTVGRQLQRWRR